MGLKKKVGMGIASAALGISLLGGTYASYFDKEVLADNDMVTGTLDLLPEMESRALFEVTNLKPGDTMTREITLRNKGSIDIKDVFFTVDYILVNAANPTGVPIDTTNTNQLDDDIIVTIWDRDGNAVRGWIGDTPVDFKDMSLKELKAATANSDVEIGGSKFNNGVALAAGETDTDEFTVQLTYQDLNNQNHQQGDAISMSLTFDATQVDGEERANNDGTPVPGEGDIVTD